MENFETWEQPNEIEETQEELKKNIDGGQTQSQDGSHYGKFNSPESLLEAYNNLQREFTKKCQKLSEFEKQKTDNEKNETSHCDETENLSPVYESAT